MEKSVLEMVGGEKYINPHYDIKAEGTSCYPVSESFTGVEINGVRFSNIGEMLRYMDKQRDHIAELEAKVEKMRCCQNCDNFKQDKYDNSHFYCALLCGIECANNKSYRMWKLKEN